MVLTGSDLEVVSRHANQARILTDFGIRCVAEDAFSRGQWDVVVEATGSPSGFSHALEAVRPRGTIVLKSTYHGTSRVDFSRIVVDEVTLVGSRCGPFRPALEWLEQGKVDPLPLTDATYPLSSALDAVHRARRPGALKVLLKNAD
jgi:threonine dehydrogenase-like Zn-dependent dehydrogenase